MHAMRKMLSNAIPSDWHAIIWCQLAKYAQKHLGCVYLSELLFTAQSIVMTPVKLASWQEDKAHQLKHLQFFNRSNAPF